jgi:hypothetical protein
MESESDKDGFRAIPHDDYSTADDITERAFDLYSMCEKDRKSFYLSWAVFGFALIIVAVAWFIVKAILP